MSRDRRREKTHDRIKTECVSVLEDVRREFGFAAVNALFENIVAKPNPNQHDFIKQHGHDAEVLEDVTNAARKLFYDRDAAHRAREDAMRLEQTARLDMLKAWVEKQGGDAEATVHNAYLIVLVEMLGLDPVEVMSRVNDLLDRKRMEAQFEPPEDNEL